jgi:hypothetical protein
VSYEELVQAALRDPDSVDYPELRLAYRSWSGYDPYGLGPAGEVTYQKVHLALRVGDVAGLIVALSAHLENQVTDIRAQQLAATAYERLGGGVTASIHRKIAQGLADSILQWGDAQSFQTAYHVLTIAEEYAVLEILGIKPRSKSLCHDQGFQFDVCQYSPAELGFAAGGNPPPEPGDQGRLSKIYFNIDAFFGTLAHQELVPELVGGQTRRVRSVSMGARLLYFTPLLVCLASALLLEVSRARDLPVLEFAGTALFMAGLGAATVNFVLLLLHAGRRRRLPAYIRGNLEFHSWLDIYDVFIYNRCRPERRAKGPPIEAPRHSLPLRVVSLPRSSGSSPSNSSPRGSVLLAQYS